MKRAISRLLCCLSLASAFAACHRRPASVAGEHSSPEPAHPPAAAQGQPRGQEPEFAVDVAATREGEAVWYDVPDGSLPERRAWAGELTAASDTLALNSYVRVRRLDGGDNGKSVVVRITDNGIRRKGTMIDLSREAAETLGMVSKGVVRVRAETLNLKNADADKPVDKKDAPPTASRITDVPAATQQQEKDASAKPGS